MVSKSTTVTLGQYFLAMARLYGIIALRDVFRIIHEYYHDSFTEDQILAFAKSQFEEPEHYCIVDPDDLSNESLDGLSLDWQIVEASLLDMGEDGYYEVLDLQDGIDFFIPAKDELLKYIDELYVGWNESAQRLTEFLEQNAQPRSSTCSMREIVEEYMFGIKIELKNAEKMDRILFYLKPPRSNQEKA